MAQSQPKIYAGIGTVAQGINQSTLEQEYIKKLLEQRRQLYKRIPHEDLKQFPFTKLVMTQRGRPIVNHKHYWYIEELIKDWQSIKPSAATLVGGSGTGQYNPATISFATSGFTLNPRPNEFFEIAIMDGKELKFHALMEYKETTGGNFVFDVKHIWLDNVTVSASDNITDVIESDWNTNNYLCCVNRQYTCMPEGSKLPAGQFQTPIEAYNCSQIIMDAFSVTGSELNEEDLFSEDKYNRYTKQMMERFNRQIEEIIRYGTVGEEFVTDANGETKLRSKCGGLRYFMQENYPENIFNIPHLTKTQLDNLEFSLGTDNTLEWGEGAYDFIKCLLTHLCKTSVRRKTLIASVSVIKDIQDIFESITNVVVNTRVENEWGFEVTRIQSTLGDLDFLIDYSSTMNPGRKNAVWIVTPDMFEYRPRLNRDVTLISGKKSLEEARSVDNAFEWVDATKRGVVADFSLNINYIDGAAIIYNWGCNFGKAA